MRINLFGGAGSGKSTMAARVFGKMKVDGRNCELVQEFIKPWAYEKRFPKSFDQLFIFASQMHAEDTYIHHVDHVISDSPLLMQCAYAKHYDFFGWEDLVSLACKYEEKYPSVNIHLRRSRKIPYKNEEGRFQDIKEAKAIDLKILQIMRVYINHHFYDVEAGDFDEVMRIINKEIG